MGIYPIVIQKKAINPQKYVFRRYIVVNINNIPNFIIIEKDILIDSRLSDKEKIVYSLICSLSNNKNKSCFANNKYICNLSNIKIRQLQNILNHLKELKYIIIHKKNNKRIITPTINKFLNERNNFNFDDNFDDLFDYDNNWIDEI